MSQSLMVKIKKKLFNPLKDWLEAAFIWVWYKFIPLLPLKVSFAIARTLSTLSLLLLKRQRDSIMSTMESAFENKMTEEEKITTAREMVANLFKGLFEGFYAASRFRNRIDGRVTIEGGPFLDQALSRGKGVIAVSAHFGNFTLLGAAMVKEHYPFHMVIRHPKNKSLARLFQMFRDLSGQKTIATQPWRECTKRMLRCLRNNEIVCLITDEDKRRGGVSVEFFGQDSPTAVGPAVLSLRTGAAILPIFIVRQKDDTHKIIIEPALACNLTGDQQEDVRLITSAFTEKIEHYIRTYPSQWFWLNRRWRKKGSPLN